MARRFKRLVSASRSAEEEVGEILATAYNNLGKQVTGTEAEKFSRFADLATKTQYKFQIRNFGQFGETLKNASPSIATFNVQLEQAYTAAGKGSDIDLNFAGEYQSTAHKYIEEIFGKANVIRAGTIGTISDKTAFGYIKNYSEKTNKQFNSAELRRMQGILNGIKRTTGQHPGGIMIFPKEKNIYEFTPLQHPAQ